MSPPRVVVTGMGAVSPNGIGRAAFWEACAAGVSGTGPITLFDPDGIPCKVAGEVKAFDVDAHLPPKTQRYRMRVVALALAAASEALAEAGIDPDRLTDDERRRTGVLVGTGAAGIAFGEEQYEVFFRDGYRRVSPYSIVATFVGMLSSEISMAFNLRGMSHVVSTGCTSASDAMGYALQALRAGWADRIVTGGAEACIVPGIMAGFCRMGTMTTRNGDPARASRPFNADRDGFVMAEGAWILVFETLESARRRGAPIAGEVLGYGTTCDAYHRVQPEPAGEEAARAITVALEDAGVAPDRVGYVNLHGTATDLNDRIESRAVRLAFGGGAERLPTSGLKSMIGHPQGACGAAGVVETLDAIKAGWLPPTINYDLPDPACDLDYVPNEGRPADIETAVVNCIAFGSKNSALVVRRWEGGRSGR
ncbi:MAG TPA: beta-ketoacyl-[acyl-carrier-protein] synthase family protein [Gemmatimonadota bacterium]|nr:beta-ketoacyl-[acyl-carrier-protein] synthase family protein [Gemmatimonadota bacterium]